MKLTWVLCNVLFVMNCLMADNEISVQQYNILDFGALPDGITLNTQSIQNAIDEAHRNGGGEVVIPKGVFLSGSILLKSGVNLHLQDEGILLGSTDPNHYIKLNRWKALVMSDGQMNIGITGGGTIDGQGRELALHVDSLFYAGQIDSIQYNFVEMRPKEYLRPQLIEFVNCENILVQGVTLLNASCWVQQYHLCKNLTIDSIRVISDAYWNNDGIDISDCKNVRITNCDIDSADDGICLKSHTTDNLCDSIYIANCKVRSSASAVKFGTRSLGGFRNITIKNIRVVDTYRSAIAIESVDGGILENVLVENIHAVNTGNAIFIRIGKRVKKFNPGILRNVTLRNIKVDIAFERPDYAYEIRGPALPFFHNTFPASITGIPGHFVENITLENIIITYPGRGNKGMAYRPLSRLDDVPECIADYPEFSMFGELPSWGFYVRHAKNLTFKNIQIGIKNPDYRPAMVFDDVENVSLKDVKIQGDEKKNQVILHKTKNVNTDLKAGMLRM